MYKFSNWSKHQDFVNAKFSSVFLDEINKYAVEREINPFKVIDEIRALECCSKYPSRTKKPAPFKGGLLNGLMHKHFISGNSIPINLMNHWEQNSESLNGAIEIIISQHQEEDIQLLAGKIAHRLVVKAYEHKNAERSMTGDWIIYKRHNGFVRLNMERAMKKYMTVLLHLQKKNFQNLVSKVEEPNKSLKDAASLLDSPNRRMLRIVCAACVCPLALR